MDIVNKSVRHDTFGTGKISDLKDEIISVRFNSAVRKFIFPDAFKEHLILTDKKSRQYVDEILEESERERQITIKEEILESEKRKLFGSLPLSDNSQAAFAFNYNNRLKTEESRCVSSGIFRSGNSRGLPRTPSRIYPNSACVLTYRDKHEPEETRYIWGVFMANEDFVGPECSDGIIPAHDKYWIVLSDDECKKFSFWKYFSDSRNNESLKWGSVELKYFSNVTMSQILHDIFELRRRTDQRQLCEEFFDYYCELNKIDKQRFDIESK